MSLRMFSVLFLSTVYFHALHVHAQPTNSVIIELVHGTWAKKSEWHKSDSDFCVAMRHAASEQFGSFHRSALESFLWSGKLTHDARIKAGQDFARHLKKYNPATRIHVVAHSHGANVVFVASQILQQQKSACHIETCSLFGAPINTERYAPNMETIKYLYNYFSLKDMIQPVFGLYKRVLPPHDRIANLTLRIEGKEPGHGDFLCTTVARWLPLIHSLCRDKQGSFSSFSYVSPGAINFFNSKKPIYALDTKRSFLLEQDEQVQKELMLDYCKRHSFPHFPQSRNGVQVDSDLFELLLEHEFSGETEESPRLKI